jgi:hypothetical protein
MWGDIPTIRWRIPPRPKAVPARRSALRHAGVVSCCRDETSDTLLNIPSGFHRTFHSLYWEWLFPIKIYDMSEIKLGLNLD